MGKALEDVRERTATAFEKMPYLAEDSDDEEAGKTQETKSEEKDKKKAKKEKKAQKKDKKKDKAVTTLEAAPETEGCLAVASKYFQRTEKAEKVKNKEPFGAKHMVALLFGTALTIGLSIQMSLLGLSNSTTTNSQTLATTSTPNTSVSNSIFAGAMMGAWLDFIRVAYKSIPQSAFVINLTRIAALISLIASIAFNNLLPKDSIWNALPLFAFSVAILVKCEWNKIKPEKFLTDRLGWNKKQVEVGSAAVQGLVATTMTAPSLPAMMQAPVGIIAKAKFRTLVNEGLKQMTSIQSSL